MTAYQKSSIGNWASSERNTNPSILKLARVLGDINVNLDAILNRGVRFEDNVDCRFVTVTSDKFTATEFSVLHGLGKVPTGYIVYGRAGAGTVYDGTTANTDTTLYLRSDAAEQEFRLIVF